MAKAEVFDRARLATLHRRLDDIDVAQAMQRLLEKFPDSEMRTLAQKSARGIRVDVLEEVHRTFCESVERALRHDGGGLEAAVATVLRRFRLGTRLITENFMRHSLEALASIAESVLDRLVSPRQGGPAAEGAYIALAETLSLAEIMNLESGLAGLALERGDEDEFRTAGNLLHIPVVVGAAGVCALAGRGDVVRIDGAVGTVEVVAWHASSQVDR